MTQQTLNNYFMYAYNNNNCSIFEKINQVKPGHYVTIDSKQNINVKRYWSIDENTFKNNFLPNKNEYFEKKNNLMKNNENKTWESINQKYIKFLNEN